MTRKRPSRLSDTTCRPSALAWPDVEQRVRGVVRYIFHPDPDLRVAHRLSACHRILIDDDVHARRWTVWISNQQPESAPLGTDPCIVVLKPEVVLNDHVRP